MNTILKSLIFFSLLIVSTTGRCEWSWPTILRNALQGPYNQVKSAMAPMSSVFERTVIDGEIHLGYLFAGLGFGMISKKLCKSFRHGGDFERFLKKAPFLEVRSLPEFFRSMKNNITHRTFGWPCVAKGVGKIGGGIGFGILSLFSCLKSLSCSIRSGGIESDEKCESDKKNAD